MQVLTIPGLSVSIPTFSRLLPTLLYDGSCPDVAQGIHTLAGQYYVALESPRSEKGRAKGPPEHP